MQTFQFLILSFLICFTLQDNNCLINIEECEERNIDMEHCVDGYIDNKDGEGKEYCTQCENEYALSDDRMKCTHIENQIENCINYVFDYNNDLSCSECKSGYVVSFDKKNCNKIENPISKCISYDSNSGNELICNECTDDYFPSKDKKKCKEFKNCDDFYYYTEACEECKSGYALSFDGKSCIKFENCYQLKEGNQKCEECAEFYHQNSEGICERTLCLEYNKEVCIQCYDGYYLNDKKECEKIPLENCIEFDKENNKCTTCIYEINPDENGKCDSIEFIKGCVEYKKDGKCEECRGDYSKTSSGSCKFIGCGDGGKKFEYCYDCKVGYYLDEDNNICIGYDGSKDTDGSPFIKINAVYTCIIFILAFLA